MTASATAITTYAPIHQLEEWLARAKPGSRVVYARGPGLDPKNPVKLMVADWEKQGEVLLNFGRSASGEPEYYVTRRAPRDIEERPARVTIDEEYRETAEGRVFVELVRAANLALPCPTNARLAELCELSDRCAAAYQVKKLKEAGRIAINTTSTGVGGKRVVTITATGRRTAEG